MTLEVSCATLVINGQSFPVSEVSFRPRLIDAPDLPRRSEIRGRVPFRAHGSLTIDRGSWAALIGSVMVTGTRYIGNARDRRRQRRAAIRALG